VKPRNEKLMIAALFVLLFVAEVLVFNYTSGSIRQSLMYGLPALTSVIFIYMLIFALKTQTAKEKLKVMDIVITPSDCWNGDRPIEYANMSECPMALKLRQILGFPVYVTVSHVYKNDGKWYATESKLGELEPPFRQSDYNNVTFGKGVFKTKFIPDGE